MADSQQHALALRPAGPNLPAWRIAPSLDRAERGEVMMLDGRGQVLSPWQVRLLRLRGALASAAGVGVAAGLVAGVLESALAGGLVAAAFAGAAWWRNLPLGDFRRAAALAAAGRRDEALQAFAALEARNLPAHHQPMVDMVVGRLAWQKARYDEAVARYRRAMESYRRPRAEGRQPAAYWVCAFDLAQVLATCGRLPEARALRAELAHAPGGDYFQLERQLTDLTLAFHADAPHELPDDLYDWAVAALRTNRFALNLVLLGWAFRARGDDEMARHILEQVPARVDGCYLAQVCPRAWTWLRTQQPRPGV